MKVEQRHWTSSTGWNEMTGSVKDRAQLVLAFGGTNVLANPATWTDIRRLYPKAHVLGCSTAGEIHDTHVSDDSLVVTAVQFESTEVRTNRINIRECQGSLDAGHRLADGLRKEGLAHVLVISDGQQVNGSELAQGLQERLPEGVAVTGGLAGDGARFQHTFVFADAPPHEGDIAVLALYGKHLRVGYGSLGGWDSFGPQRLVTKSKGNVLFELDGQPALALYKRYLGQHASGLPATGLLFPLSVQATRDGHEVVRTILSINEAEQSLTFAGDIPQGGIARLMKANFDRLVDGAHGAAENSRDSIGDRTEADLAILISCVGRKLVLKQRTEQELEAVREVLGPRPVMAGFYSYGEICPSSPKANCELHNQTMTITTLRET